MYIPCKTTHTQLTRIYKQGRKLFFRILLLLLVPLLCIFVNQNWQIRIQLLFKLVLVGGRRFCECVSYVKNGNISIIIKIGTASRHECGTLPIYFLWGFWQTNNKTKLFYYGCVIHGELTHV